MAILSANDVTANRQQNVAVSSPTSTSTPPQSFIRWADGAGDLAQRLSSQALNAVNDMHTRWHHPNNIAPRTQYCSMLLFNKLFFFFMFSPYLFASELKTLSTF
jgi:hypothetical protein